jgi:hypothetical protein
MRDASRCAWPSATTTRARQFSNCFAGRSSRRKSCRRLGRKGRKLEQLRGLLSSEQGPRIYELLRLAQKSYGSRNPRTCTLSRPFQLDVRTVPNLEPGRFLASGAIWPHASTSPRRLRGRAYTLDRLARVHPGSRRWLGCLTVTGGKSWVPLAILVYKVSRSISGIYEW